MEFPIDDNAFVSVRVHCEAPDCYALLEVAIDRYRCYESPTIVRCGKCRRLLEVNLRSALMPFSSQHRSRMIEGYPAEGRVGSMWGETVSTGSRHLQDTTLKMHRAPLMVQSRDATITCNPTILSQERRTLNVTDFEKPPPLTRSLRHQSLNVNTTGSERTPMNLRTLGEFQPTLLPIQSKPKIKKQKSQKGRKPSVYNIFMQQALKQILAADPTIDHKQAFKLAASRWMRAPNVGNSPAPAPVEPIATSYLYDDDSKIEAGFSDNSPESSAMNTKECWMDVPDYDRHHQSMMELLRSECST